MLGESDEGNGGAKSSSVQFSPVKEGKVEERKYVMGDSVNVLLGDVWNGISVLIAMVLEESDSRLGRAMEALNQAVWKTGEDVDKLTGGKDRLISQKELRDLTNAMQGRVLTVIDAVFESPVQREAVKSLARQKVWRFHNRAEKYEDPEKAGS